MLRAHRRLGAARSYEHSYNEIAVAALERLCALSDGVFAFAMTLLVLDIRVPPTGALQSAGELWHAPRGLLPRFVMYAMSFPTLGIFWVGQQTQLNQLQRAERDLAWLHIGFLAAVAILPFSTQLLAEFIENAPRSWCTVSTWLRWGASSTAPDGMPKARV